MSNFMQKVKRKWNIQKLGVQLVGIEAMAYYLLVGVSVLLVALLVSVRIFFAYDITNSDYTMYLNFFGILMLASNPLYWICKDMGEKRKKKLLIDKKGAVDSMEILAILPIQKREGVNCNFYRWLLVNILNVIAIIYMEFNAVKYGMATIPEKFFVVFPLFSMLFQTLYWIAVIVNQRWIFLASSVIGMVSYMIFLFAGMFNGFEGIAHKNKSIVHLQKNTGITLSCIAVLWLLGLTIWFHFLNKKKRAWME